MENSHIAILAKVGIRFFEFRSFPINSCRFEFPDSRFRGNNKLKVTQN